MQTREHQAVLCASGAIAALASLLSLSAGNEKVSLLSCLLDSFGLLAHGLFRMFSYCLYNTDLQPFHMDVH